MKKILIALLVFLPLSVSAESVQIYPTITNAHGGTKSAVDITVCWEINGVRSCNTSVPTFNAPVGSPWLVVPTPPSGYSAATRGACEGTSQSEANVICTVNYSDGAPIIVPLPAPPQPVITPINDIAIPSLPTPVVTGAPVIEGVTPEMTRDEQIASLQAQIIELYKLIIALLQKRIAEIQ